MMNFRFYAFILNALVALFFVSPALAQQLVGHVGNIQGEVSRSQGQETHALQLGQEVYLGDTIETQAAAKVKIDFIDATEISIGVNGSLVIDDYVYDPDNADNNKAEFSLPTSAFHYVSGLIAKKDKPDVTLNLDFGSIGIRGTEIWRDMIKDQSGRFACRIFVEEGRIKIKNSAGSMIVNQGLGTKLYAARIVPEAPAQWGDKALESIKSKSRF